MKTYMLTMVFLGMFATAQTAFADTATSTALVLNPPIVIQGEPVMATLPDLKLPDIKKATFDGKPIDIFLYHNTPTALIGVDFRKKPGTYEIMLTKKDASTIKANLVVNARPKIEEPLGVPAKLGGNSPANQKKVVDQLVKESAVLEHLATIKKVLWKDAFQYPVADPIVTDSYGYSRTTGAYTIPHKGTDFHAPLGTKVLAMNRGIVRLVANNKIYGKTIVIDHGFGVSTIYLHLSKFSVHQGELVNKGQVIALSGKTGYAESPHLHLSVRINNVSIDPMKFLVLVGEQRL